MNLKITWTDPHTGESGKVKQIQDVVETDSAAAALRERALRDACKVICAHCGEGREVIRDRGMWMHPATDTETRDYCNADDLQELIWQEARSLRILESIRRAEGGAG